MTETRTAATLESAFRLLARRALIVGIVLVTTSMAGGIFAPQQFFRSYLLGFIFWIAFPLGSLSFLMLHYLTGGQWGLPIKRVLEAGCGTLPLFALLVIPCLFGLGHLFSWTSAETVANDPILQAKHLYLNVPFFIGRQVLYFTVWLWLAWYIARSSARLDETGDARTLGQLETMSGPGLLLYGATVTFFSIDWVMSLEPHWFSTIFGTIFIVIQTQVGIALGILVAGLLGRRQPVADALSPARLNDLGNLLLAFTMLWAYLGFSQFLIIWSGNLLTEIEWYLSRANSGWAVMALCLVAFYFAAPFLLLLMRDVKRRASALAALAALVLVMNFVNVFWMIVPSFHPQGPRFHLLDLLLPLGIGSLWLAAFVWKLSRGPLLPERDPRFQEALELGR